MTSRLYQSPAGFFGLLAGLLLVLAIEDASLAAAVGGGLLALAAVVSLRRFRIDRGI
jgi:hypothetical protein